MINDDSDNVISLMERRIRVIQAESFRYKTLQITKAALNDIVKLGTNDPAVMKAFKQLLVIHYELVEKI